MSVCECAPNHFLLDESHPLAKDLYANVFSEVAPSSGRNVTRLFDVSSVTERPMLFRKVIEFLAQRYRAMGDAGPTHILAVESRGYLIGAPLAVELGLPLVLVRETKRFPASFVRESQQLNELPPSQSIRNGSVGSNARVLIVEDFVGCGRTAVSVLRLAGIVGATVVEMAAVCDAAALKGVEAIHAADGGAFRKTPIFTLMRFRADNNTLREQMMVYNPHITASKL
ncbi:putative Adenine phosphoribosyltransferase [Trypanosoma theileri]|uniref:adenine phosphoribosyltransferase n=1 Tax=Trypanosoma theileri TaxID=67003 RepID=A0A1X0NT10_9TRYP|nr:putative Adenine phosphoribosyltransferase [Trypanosoma theileri]ORC87678.1 putative Adenine phosphoribosyltransferase [Trypanosoma theileri]